jgi:NAD(P)-dependent dehydrogenase (short-subunit alcohol dehydrogenase family)
MRLEGKVAVVTGGARNIGAFYSKHLATEGARVVVADVLDGSKVVKKIEKANGQAIALKVDVSKEEDTVRMAEETVQRFGRIDILVNNAAIFLSINRRPFYDLSAEEWDQLSSVNIKGPFLCAKSVFPQMSKQKSGKIINISSTTALAGTPLFLHYVPGLVDHEGQTVPKEFTEFQLKARSFKRLQTPDDLVGTLVYLASSDSDFVTGQTLVVDGGSILY